ncbi:hypothetical protein AB0953_27900 [Streptomyces sp. NPDC046866]|uniref:hypothetical protein n=1 Tax=Streptomyces sp. NPDC046866 TaxID=3154921 RepID=UPI00345732C3
MANVRGHYRKNGSYVRPHTRRTKPGSGSRRPAVPQPRPAGATTNVRGHYRNGSYVRPHQRRLGAPVVVAAGGGGLLLLIIVLVALFGGGGEAPAGTSPSPAVSATGAPR